MINEHALTSESEFATGINPCVLNRRLKNINQLKQYKDHFALIIIIYVSDAKTNEVLHFSGNFSVFEG